MKEIDHAGGDGDERRENEQDIKVLAPIQFLDDDAGQCPNRVHDVVWRVWIADDIQEGLFQIGLMLRDEIADASRRLEFALVDDGHAVTNGFHFAQFVRRKENGFALVFQALDDFADLHASQRVEAAGRFVENQQVGIIDQRLREADALLHSLGIGFDGTFARPGPVRPA